MKIAFHKVVITPKEPSYLCGHAMRVHLHEDVLDDLYISVLRLKNDGEDYLFASIDLVGLDKDLVDQMKSVGKAHGIPEDHVIVSVIHTHAAVEYMYVNIFSGNPDTGARQGYRAFLIEKFEEAIQGCTQFEEVEVAYGTTTIDGYYGNRNDRNYPCDKMAHFIQFLKEGKPTYMMVNISCHPTVLGPENYKISADLFGWIRKDLSEHYHVPVFMMNGAQGDVSNRQYRQGNDEAELARVTTGICEQLYNISFTPAQVTPMSIKDITYVIDYMSDPKDIDVEITRAKMILETETNPDILKITKSGIAFLEMNKYQDPHVHEEIKTRIMQMGEITIVTVAAELFTKFSLQIKNAFLNKKIFIWGITDNSVGYLVEENEYGKNYESMTTRIPKGEVEKYIDHILVQISNM